MKYDNVKLDANFTDFDGWCPWAMQSEVDMIIVALDISLWQTYRKPKWIEKEVPTKISN